MFTLYLTIPKTLLTMKDKTNIVSALYSLLVWLIKLVVEDIYIGVTSFWQGFYVDNKFTYAVFLVMIGLAFINSCHG